jgi:hypothetical protein
MGRNAGALERVSWSCKHGIPRNKWMLLHSRIGRRG